MADDQPEAETPTADAAPDAAADAGEAAQPADSTPDALDDEPDANVVDDNFGPPFSSKTFGGAFVWARSEHYVSTVLRVKEGENVVVSTQGRTDMIVMLTGGRAVLEVGMPDGDIDRIELMPASPFPVEADKTYRLLAVTEVELFTVFAPLR